MSWKRVPDSWSCDVETVYAKFGPRPWHKHVAALSRTEVWPTSDVDHQRAYVLEVGWPSAVNTVISGGCHLELYSLRHWQPMEDVAKNRSNAVELAGANNQTGGGVQHHLQATGDLRRRRKRLYSSRPGSRQMQRPGCVGLRLSVTVAHFAVAGVDRSSCRRRFGRVAPRSVHRRWWRQDHELCLTA